MSRILTPPSVTPQYASLTAGEAITAGDLVVYEPQTSSAYYADDTGLRPIWRPSTVNGYPIVSATTLDSSFPFGGYGVIGSAVLSNGNIVIIWITSTGGFTVKFKIVDPNGATVVATTTAATMTAGYNQIFFASVTALSGGGFVVFRGDFGGGSSNNLYKLTGFTNTGSSAFSEITIATTGLSSGPCGASAATGTGFALVWADNGTSYVYSALYDSTGTRVGSVINSTISAGYISGGARQLAICAGPSSGGYSIAYNAANTGSLKTFNSSGTQLTNTSPTSTLTNVYSGSVAVAANSSVAVMMNNQSNGGNQVCYFANNTQFSAYLLASTTNYLVQYDIVALTNGTFVAAGMASTSGGTGGQGLIVRLVTSAGISSGGIVQLDGDSALTNSTNSLRITALPNGNAAIVVTRTTDQTLWLYVIDSSLTLLSKTLITSAGGYYSYSPSIVPVTNGSYATVMTSYSASTGYPTIVENLVTSLYPRYPYGVATASAASAATVGVQTVGAATTRLSFATQTVNSSVSGGNVLQLNNTQATLQGLTQPNTKLGQQPSGVFGNGNVQFILSTSTFTIPSKTIRVRLWGGGGGGGTSGSTSSFGTYCSASGGNGGSSTGSAGTGSGGDINTTGGIGPTSAGYTGGGGAANYFGNGNVTSGKGGSATVSPYNGENGLTGIGGAVGLSTAPAKDGLSNIPNQFAAIDFIGTGPGGGGSSQTTYLIGGNGSNGGGGGGSYASIAGNGGFPGGAGGNYQSGTIYQCGGGFALKSISNLTVGASVAVTVATPVAATNYGGGGGGLVIVEW